MPGIEITIRTEGAPQSNQSKWFARPNDGTPEFRVGATMAFSDGDGPHIGLAGSRFPEFSDMAFDRHKAQSAIGLRAHFIWPTVTAESGSGHHFTLNSYDRARFTFGFCQLAAHTPKANLILLFRKLLILPDSGTYFPDLRLKNGVLHKTINDRLLSLETETNVTRKLIGKDGKPTGITKSECQLVDFMNYLNPNTHLAEPREAETAARLMLWLSRNPGALATATDVGANAITSKIKGLSGDLRGRQVALGIWAADILHQGRGSSVDIRAALAKTTEAEQRDALYAIDKRDPKTGQPMYKNRRDTIKATIASLDAEGVFTGVKLGDPKLPM